MLLRSSLRRAKYRLPYLSGSFSTSRRLYKVGNLDRQTMSTTDDDEDLKAAIAAFLETAPKNDKAPASAAIAQTCSILGLDRAAMERERLARTKRRKASISPPAPPSKRVNTVTASPPERSPKSSSKSTHESRSSKQTVPGVAQNLKYLSGRVLKTWAFGHPRQGDDIKLEEILQKDDLQLAVLSSFIWDTEWLFKKLNLSKTRVICAMQAKDEMTKTELLENTKDVKNLKLAFPSMAGLINCMHSKLMLLGYPTHLRVVVPSGNLIPHDWGETGGMENVLFIIDLPRLPEGNPKPKMTRFGEELARFCKALGVIDDFSKFDFSATEDLAFVHTIGGAHTDEEMRDNTGYLGLARAVQGLGLQTDGDITIDFVTSSLGNINETFLSGLYHAARGQALLKPEANPSKTTNSKSTLHAKPQSKAPSRISNPTITTSPAPEFHPSNFLIYFPTLSTITSSTTGPSGAGTICLSSKYFHSPNFPRDSLRDCKSVRKGLVMHSKIMYVRHLRSSNDAEKEPQEQEQEGKQAEEVEEASKDYAYIGSANLSESAWGKVVVDRKLKKEKLNCRNWECGVLVPVRRRRCQNNQSQERTGRVVGDHELVEVFKGVVPVPMEHPAEEYGGRKPWFAFG